MATTAALTIPSATLTHATITNHSGMATPIPAKVTEARENEEACAEADASGMPADDRRMNVAWAW